MPWVIHISPYWPGLALNDQRTYVNVDGEIEDGGWGFGFGAKIFLYSIIIIKVLSEVERARMTIIIGGQLGSIHGVK